MWNRRAALQQGGTDEERERQHHGVRRLMWVPRAFLQQSGADREEKKLHLRLPARISDLSTVYATTCSATLNY